MLLINIDKKTYDHFIHNEYGRADMIAVHNAINNGIPLPKELSELLFKQDMRITALAYAHALYLNKYGVDIDKASRTATENAEMLAKAYQQGYYDALEQISQITEIEERQCKEDKE